MKKIASSLTVALLAATTLAACAQSTPGGAGTTSGMQPAAWPMTTTEMPAGRGGSAHVRNSWVVNGANIAIEYGRPALKGRAEAQMMPLGRPWRSGADAATIITTDRTLTFGTTTLRPGTYTINTQPGADQWQIIFGTLKAPGQWGVPYQPALELGRAPMQRSMTSIPVEMVTFHIDRTAGGQALRLEWGTTSVSTPFTVGG